jgi:hypothetical protein
MFMQRMRSYRAQNQYYRQSNRQIAKFCCVLAGEPATDAGGINAPLLATRQLPIDEEGNQLLDFAKLSLVPRRTRTRTRAQQELMHQSQIPLFMKRYCVVWHYRPQSRFKTAALSVFRIHNETVNIWSHALGALADEFTSFSLHMIFGHSTVSCLRIGAIPCTERHQLLRSGAMWAKQPGE